MEQRAAKDKPAQERGKGRNFDRLMEAELERLGAASGQRPRLLLHACCAPCSSAVTERLAGFFETTIFYYNPNIHPEPEYRRRLGELQSFVRRFPPAKGIRLVVPPYNAEDYFLATRVRQEAALQAEPERGERCRRCYLFRMEKAFRHAASGGFDYFTTTLSVSPHKDAEKINEIGAQLEQKARAAAVPAGSATESPAQERIPAFLFADFKKRNGYKRSLELSGEYGLYRQDYCGCVFSRLARRAEDTKKPGP